MIRPLIFLLAGLIGAAVPAQAAETLAGPLRVEPGDPVDGDTFGATVPVWFDMNVKTSVRIRGVDTPELHPARCALEKQMGLAAKAKLADLLKAGPVVLTNVQQDKYGGRVDATVTINGINLAESLIAAGLGRPYSGATRQPWCVATPTP